MNRRRFLKYAGVSAIAIGASALGLDYALKSPSMLNPSTRTTSTSELSSSTKVTTSAVQLSSLASRLFFDYNGNGRQDGGEPAVSPAELRLKDWTGKVVAEANADSSGGCELEDIPVGSYQLEIEADDRFRYMCTSVDEFTPVEEGYEIILNEPKQMDIGLAEGFLTLPFKFEVDRISQYVDLGYPASNRDWEGGTVNTPQHTGTDYGVREGTPVVAAAPGLVVSAEDDYPQNTDLKYPGIRVILDHGHGFRTAYNHLSKLNIEGRKVRLPIDNTQSDLQKVKRGEVIGFSGNTGNSTGPHLHFEVNKYPPNAPILGYHGYGWAGGIPIDPYRDLFYNTKPHNDRADPVSLWTKDNDPQYAVA